MIALKISRPMPLFLTALPLVWLQEGVANEEGPIRTPRIESFALHGLADRNGDSADDLLVVSRWGYVEDHGLPPQHTAFEILDGRTGRTLVRSEWEPTPEPRFDVRTLIVLDGGPMRLELSAFEHEAGSWASSRSAYTFCVASPDNVERRLSYTAERVPGREFSPKLLASTGDFDGDGRGDVVVLATSSDAAAEPAGEAKPQPVDLAFLHSSGDGRLLGRLAQPVDPGPVHRGFSIAPGSTDVTGDDVPDVVIAARVRRKTAAPDGLVLVYSGAGLGLERALGPYDHIGEFGRIDASADVDGDGARDVLFGTHPVPPSKDTCAVRVVSCSSGQVLLEFRTRIRGEVDTFFVRDRDGDGVDDVFALVSPPRGFRGDAFHGSIHSSATGKELAFADLSAVGGLGSATFMEPTRMGDVDGDGLEEIALAITRTGDREPSAQALAVLSGATLATRYERVLAGKPERSGAEKDARRNARWRETIDSGEPLTPPSLELIQSWPKRPAFKTVEELAGVSFASADLESRNLWLAPDLMRRLAPYYHEPPWSVEEVDWIVGLCQVLALWAAEAELAVEGREPEQLRAGLARVKAWWEEGCKDDDFIADLVIFMNDGPFHGAPVATTEIEGLPTLGSVELTPNGGRVDLLSGKAPPRLYLQHVRPDGVIAWSRRLSTDEGAEAREPAGLTEEPVELQRGFGWKVPGYVTWSGGTESAYFYLDPTGRLRFYALSW